jgi:hypothetical protein
MPSEEMGGRRLPQSPEVSAGPVMLAVFGFLAFTAVSMGILFFYLRAASPGSFAPAVKHPYPEPELQVSPQDDLRKFEAAQRAALSGYAWIDRSKGLARIPIAEAMQIIVSRGQHAYDAPDKPVVGPETDHQGAQP